MPFVDQKGRPYTRSNVDVLNPNQMGVYGIYNATQWIYIGSGDIRELLLGHLNGDMPCIDKAQPTGWVGEISNTAAVRARELILEFKPLCNR